MNPLEEAQRRAAAAAARPAPPPLPVDSGINSVGVPDLRVIAPRVGSAIEIDYAAAAQRRRDAARFLNDAVKSINESADVFLQEQAVKKGLLTAATAAALIKKASFVVGLPAGFVGGKLLTPPQAGGGEEAEILRVLERDAAYRRALKNTVNTFEKEPVLPLWLADP